MILSEQELTAIGELARRHSLWLVADEVYAGLAPGGRVPGLAARLPEQVITVSSISKSHSLPGLRAGWLVGPKPLIKHAESLAMCMLFGLPGFIQEATITALEVADQAESRIRDLCTRAARYAARRDLKDVRGIRCCVPDAGMFTLMDVRGTGLSGYDFMCALYNSERAVGDRRRRLRRRNPRLRAAVFRRR